MAGLMAQEAARVQAMVQELAEQAGLVRNREAVAQAAGPAPRAAVLAAQVAQARFTFNATDDWK